MPIRFFLILGAFFVSVLMWVDRACISAAKSDIATDLGFDDRQMGWVMAAFSLGYALFQVPSGKLADRYGPRVVMTVVCLMWSLFTALTGVVRGWTAMIGLRFLFGMGEAGGYPTLARAFTQWLPMNERGITNSISFSGGRLGAALAMPGVVWLMSALGGWEQTFYFFGAVGIAFAATWFFLFRDSPETHFAVTERERDYIVNSRDPAKKQGETATAEQAPIRFAEMLRSPNMLMLMFQYVAHNFTFFFTVTWFFPYLKETFSLTKDQTALYAAVPLLCGVVGNWIAGFTVDRLYSRGRWQASRRIPAAIGFVLSAIGMSACINMNTPVTAVAAMSVAIFGADMILSPSWSTCMDIGGKSAGAVSGAMNMVGNLGAFCTSLAFPYLYRWTGTHEPFFYIASGLNVVAIFMWFRIRPDVEMADEVRTVN
ncbi:putative sulfoacetate transporter SauU [Rubripirellula lacrimiformis]|uniref:Putative sulfoacetate transporter SauU n=1 Tax=Rubripirellula lacrimiformis TaxID=1930273 RepID=A0A517NGH9_9BACT|nr:MFS transporter [Rubripirellula lacrimiformis]QDT06239.1 putative sulfoacetate transporter SauU [Rubripirellula lacrimiformis]